MFRIPQTFQQRSKSKISCQRRVCFFRADVPLLKPHGFTAKGQWWRRMGTEAQQETRRVTPRKQDSNLKAKAS